MATRAEVTTFIDTNVLVYAHVLPARETVG